MLAYQRVYKQILQALKDNTYPIGSLLPAEPELEKIYGVSPYNSATCDRAVG